MSIIFSKQVDIGSKFFSGICYTDMVEPRALADSPVLDVGPPPTAERTQIEQINWQK